MTWTPAFARIAWRLHVPDAIPHFVARATASEVSEEEGMLAVDGLAFVESADAEIAMKRIQEASSGAIRAMAEWWLEHRRVSGWTVR